MPLSIAKECIEVATDYFHSSKQTEFWANTLEFTNTDSLSYTTNKDNLENTGGVGLYSLPIPLQEKIFNYYKNSISELSTYTRFYIQIVTGGHFVAPHFDGERAKGLLYLLKSGGPNVRTKFYRIKEEYKHLKKDGDVGIPYYKLDVVEDQCLEENTWHSLNFKEIHSVENQESLRMFIWGHPEFYH